MNRPLNARGFSVSFSPGKRVAFLIGNQTFHPDSGLVSLQGPANDVIALARVLRDPGRGNFEVHELLDNTQFDILSNIEKAFYMATENDLLLLYYSGHGLLDRMGQLHFATIDTRRDALRSTSISARDLRDLAEASNCGQVVLLLDCGYSGAAASQIR